MKKNILAAVALTVFVFTSLHDSDAQPRDWAAFGRYAKSNSEIISAQKAGARKPVAVLLGDSITDAWATTDPDFFSVHNFVGRGISGQTSSEMLVRFRRDVIDLHPKYVLILAGTNDMAQNNGPIEIENTFGNIVSMCELARQNKIKPVICSVIPATSFGWRKQIGNRSEDIITLNRMLKAYATRNKLKYIDYHSSMKDGQNGLRNELGRDSVHPNLSGYHIMEKLVLQAIGK